MPKNKYKDKYDFYFKLEKDLSDISFKDKYGSEDKCISEVTKKRWPNGFICKTCGGRDYSFLTTRKLFQCSFCRKQTSLIAGTVFQGTKIPLFKWFIAMHYIMKGSISDNELSKYMNVSINTAFSVRRKLQRSLKHK